MPRMACSCVWCRASARNPRSDESVYAEIADAEKLAVRTLSCSGEFDSEWPHALARAVLILLGKEIPPPVESY